MPPVWPAPTIARTRDQLIANNAVALVDDFAAPILGNPYGDVWIVEFFDYTCPYCKAAEPRLHQHLKRDGKVKLILKEFPILSRRRSPQQGGLAANIQGKYAAYHDRLMG